VTTLGQQHGCQWDSVATAPASASSPANHHLHALSGSRRIPLNSGTYDPQMHSPSTHPPALLPACHLRQQARPPRLPRCRPGAWPTAPPTRAGGQSHRRWRGADHPAPAYLGIEGYVWIDSARTDGCHHYPKEGHSELLRAPRIKNRCSSCTL